MPSHSHAAVWIDHHQARIYYVGRTGADQIVLRSDKTTQQIHHKANSTGSGHASEDKDFLKRAAMALEGIGTILILGPSVEKTVFHHFLRDHDPKIFQCVTAVENSDHPSDGEIIAYAKRYFGLENIRST